MTGYSTVDDVIDLAKNPSNWSAVLSFARHPHLTLNSLSYEAHTPTMVGLQKLNFNDISHREYDTVALFPDFHATDRLTVMHGLLAHALHYRGVDSVFLFGGDDFHINIDDDMIYDTNTMLANELSSEMKLNTYFTDKIDYNLNSVDENAEKMIEKYGESSVIERFRTTEIDSNNSKQNAVYDEYIKVGRKAWKAIDELNKSFEFDYLVTSASTYLPKAISLEYAKRHGMVVTDSSDPVHGKSGRETYFSRTDSITPHYITDETWKSISRRSLSQGEQDKITNYLQNRFQNTKQLQFADLASTVNFDSSNHVYSMYTHLPWESAIRDLDRVFEDQYSWAVRTIQEFEQFNDKQLVVKIHPSEEIYETNVSAQEIIESRIDKLPKNVDILPPTTDISPYTLIRESDVVLVYTSTIGMESIYLDTPVVTVGDAHYAGKGFTYDPQDIDEYLDHLARSPEDLEVSPDQKRDALKYMYNYFIDRPIDVDIIRSEPDKFRSFVLIDSVEELKPGRNETVDRLCEAITEETGYYYAVD